ncbi:hypothetical protein EDB89DRAFT_1464344 [Lactarius sanguifluus]|nr:hypothetical protein EDB89DRAFT_1464344 [Lactarius sanguifluus]
MMTGQAVKQNELNKLQPPSPTHTEFGREQYTNRITTNCVHVAERSLYVAVGVLCSAAAPIHTAASARRRAARTSPPPSFGASSPRSGPFISSPFGTMARDPPCPPLWRSQPLMAPFSGLIPHMGNAERVIQHYPLAPCSRFSVISQPTVKPCFFFALLPWGSLNLMQKPSYLPNHHSARTTEEEQQSTRDSCLDRYRSLCLFFWVGFATFSFVGRSATANLGTDSIYPTLAVSSYVLSQDFLLISPPDRRLELEGRMPPIGC